MNTDGSDTDHKNEECVFSQSGVEYSTRPVPARRRMQNILTQSSKVIANLEVKLKVLTCF